MDVDLGRLLSYQGLPHVSSTDTPKINQTVIYNPCPPTHPDQVEKGSVMPGRMRIRSRFSQVVHRPTTVRDRQIHPSRWPPVPVEPVAAASPNQVQEERLK
jgi:hypothetical protein